MIFPCAPIQGKGSAERLREWRIFGEVEHTKTNFIYIKKKQNRYLTNFKRFNHGPRRINTSHVRVYHVFRRFGKHSHNFRRDLNSTVSSTFRRYCGYDRAGKSSG